MEETVNTQENLNNEIHTIDEYLDAVMNAETEFSHLFEKSLDKEEYLFNALKKNMAMVAVNAQMVDSNDFDTLKNLLDIDKFKDTFLEDYNLSYLALSLFQFGFACGEIFGKYAEYEDQTEDENENLTVN